jgi:hypothetical protein
MNRNMKGSGKIKQRFNLRFILVSWSFHIGMIEWDPECANLNAILSPELPGKTRKDLTCLDNFNAERYRGGRSPD